MFFNSALGTVWNDRSVLGETRGATPLVIPVRGFVDDVRKFVVGDLHIGRGCKQRALPRSAFANPYMVSTYGRPGAVAMFRKHLESDLPVRKSVWA